MLHKRAHFRRMSKKKVLNNGSRGFENGLLRIQMSSLHMNVCSKHIPIAHAESLVKSFIQLTLIDVFYLANINRCIKNPLGVMVWGLSRDV